MKQRIIRALLILGLTCIVFTDDSNEQDTSTNDFLCVEALIVTKHKYVICSIVYIVKNKIDESETGENIKIILSEAHIDEDGRRTNDTLSMLEELRLTTILKGGRDVASSRDYLKIIYVSASHGLFVYKPEDKTIARHGSITDSIIGIAQVPKSDLYILTEDHNVYEVTEDGEKYEIDGIENAQQIVLDYDSNLYYYTPDKKVHIYTSEGIKDVDGLPDNSSKIVLFKPSIHLYKGIVLLSDNVPYTVFPNGTSVISGKKIKPERFSIVYSPFNNTERLCSAKDEQSNRLCFFNIFNPIILKKFSDSEESQS